MELTERLEQQIKDLQSFMNTQKEHVKGYQSEISKNIDLIEDKTMKVKLGKMMSEAMKGNIENVQRLAKNIQKDFEVKNKENAD